MEDFSSYDLIIDARSEREYEEDHIPGAINLPVINNDEYAEVGTTHRDDKHQAYLIGVAYSHRNIANHIDQVIGKYARKTKILVYCFRGGKRSRLWFDALDTIGYGSVALTFFGSSGPLHIGHLSFLSTAYCGQSLRF